MSSLLRPPSVVDERTVLVDRDSSSSLGTKPLRVRVNLSNGARILVPVDGESTVTQLVAESARRAIALNLSYDTNEATLRSDDGSVLFGEDSLKDVLDLAENPNLFLGRVEAQSSIPSSVSPSSASSVIDSGGQSQSSNLYIRWITTARALNQSRLKSLPAERIAVSSDITLSELKELAFDKLNLGTEHTTPPAVSVELFLTSCHLSSDAGSITLRKLELEGTKAHPLDIFAVLVSTAKVAAGRPDILCGFTSTQRGIATFHTCLSIFLKELTDKKINLDNIMAVIWEITHFPPAVIALRQLHEHGSIGAKPLYYAVFASSFRETALQMVPPNISANPESILESSRQIFAWLRSLSSEGYRGLDGSHLALVHKVELREIQSDQNSRETSQPGRYNHNDYVEFRVWTSEEPSSIEASHKMVLVSKEQLDTVKPDLLAAALWGSYGSPCNFYFNIPPSATQIHDHRRVSLLHPQDFDNLIQKTNQVDGFKMIGPLQLGHCTSSTLPVITLDSEGYVSTYDQQDQACSERELLTRNIFRNEVLSGSDPGQYLLQKLNPLIRKRKEEKTWEVDAWDDASQTIDSRIPEEAIVICVDRSGSMHSKMKQTWMPTELGKGKGKMAVSELNRLSEVKEVFKNLVSRISAYRLPTHIGLVTFSDLAKVEQQLTPILYDFQNRLDDIVAGGSTALFDSLVTAQDMLDTFKSSNPKAKCRIIVLTDGLNNWSTTKPEKVCSKLYDSGIILDAIVIGTTETQDLFKMAKHTGGYAFHPQTRDMLFQIFLLDGFLDINSRPDIQKVSVVDYASSFPKAADMQTIFDFPPCRTQPYENDSFIPLQSARKHFTGMVNRLSRSSSVTTSIDTTDSGRQPSSTGTTLVGGAGGQGRVFLNEIVAMINNPHPSMDVYASESNMGVWKVVMVGPSGSAYENGTFVLFIELGDQFPMRPPSARFKTPVLHPNVTKHGRICHEIFSREWQSGIHVFEVLRHIWGIFFSLEARDAVDPLFTLKFWTDPEGGRREVEEYVKHFASQTREQHCAEILGASHVDSAFSTGSNTPVRTLSVLSGISSAETVGSQARPLSNAQSGSAGSGSRVSFFRRLGRHLG